MTELSKRPNYRADIQGLRGVAVLLVVLFHAGLPVPGGFVGVDVFFVISGYVIAEGIVRALEKGTFSFRDFYVKRMRRLLPALAVMLSVVMLLMVFFGPPVAMRTASHTGVAASLFNANHYLLLGRGYFDPSTEYNAFLHTWSLSVEEQFYFGFPLLLFTLWRIGSTKTGRSRVFWGIAAASIASGAASLWLSYTPYVERFSGQSLAFYTVIARAWQFGVGALVALGAHRARQSWVSHGHLGTIGIVMIICASFVFDDTTVFPGIAVFLPTAGAALVILAGLRKESSTVVSTALATRGMVRLGDLSYSWYLWHWPLIVFAAATFPHIPLQASVVAAFASLGVAVLNERYVEAPVRFRPKMLQWPALALLFACVFSPIVGWQTQVALQKLVFTDARVSTKLILRSAQAQNEYKSLGCDGTMTFEEVGESCRWGDRSDPKVLLVGDSNARHWIPAFREVIPSLKRELIATTLSACPFIDGEVQNADTPSQRCRNWVARSVKEIVDNPPELVIISNAIDIYAADSKFVYVNQSNGQYVRSADAKLMEISQALHSMIQIIENAGSKVVVVAPVPKFQVTSEGGWISDFKARRLKAFFYRCSVTSLILRPSWCQVRRNLAANGAYQMGEDVSAMFLELSSLGVNVVDAKGDVCPFGECVMFDFDSSEILYADSLHISGDGARLGKTLFFDTLTRILNQ